MVRRTITLAATLLLLSNIASADDLAGLWKAKKRFGPDARGTLIVQRSGDTYTADFVGRIVPVTVASGELSFSLPDHQGTFRGRLDARGTITGHWFRPGSGVNTAYNGAPVAASYVQLNPDGANRWRGIVDPFQDTFTFFLLLEPRADGSYSAVLRNPERDIGTQQGVERLVRDGNKLSLIGKRNGKEQEVASGTYDADGEVMIFRWPTRGGSYDFMREGDESEFYPRGKNPGRYVYRPPLARDDGWPVGTLDAANIDRPFLESFIQRLLDTPMNATDVPQQHGLLIARHGKLVLEEYFHGEHRDKLHDTRSATKSLSSLVVGAALYAGVPVKLSSPVYAVMNGGAFPPDLEEAKKTMTLEHLLTMSGGFFCDDTNDAAPGNETTMGDQTDEPDFYKYTMRVPLATPPGENSVYCSAMPNLALGMVGRAAKENPMSLFDRLIGEPLKIRKYSWGLDPAGNPYGGGSTSLTLRDFAKLGQLVLNGGTWEGKRIISREFAANCGAPLYHLRNVYYGYLWWNEDYPYKGRMVHTFSARGAGGQNVTVVPELDLVVATFAASFGSRKAMFAASNDLMPNIILPAVRQPGDDPKAPVVELHYVTPYGVSKDGSRVTPQKK
ncbi:MAG TPA: serine hydrolase [Thermoanaerobaculia bacterium]|nr:serine hydrolase [Thermoanaerobaculia bacterium]